MATSIAMWFGVLGLRSFGSAAVNFADAADNSDGTEAVIGLVNLSFAVWQGYACWWLTQATIVGP